MIKLKKITPLYTGVVTTADKYVETRTLNGIICPTSSTSSLQEYQKVLAIGSSVRGVKVGDMVCINPNNYKRTVQSKDVHNVSEDIEGYTAKVVYNFNMVNLDGKDCLFIQERDIDFVLDEYEEVSDIEVISPTIIKPR